MAAAELTDHLGLHQLRNRQVRPSLISWLTCPTPWRQLSWRITWVCTNCKTARYVLPYSTGWPAQRHGGSWADGSPGLAPTAEPPGTFFLSQLVDLPNATHIVLPLHLGGHTYVRCITGTWKFAIRVWHDGKSVWQKLAQIALYPHPDWASTPTQIRPVPHPDLCHLRGNDLHMIEFNPPPPPLWIEPVPPTAPAAPCGMCNSLASNWPKSGEGTGPIQGKGCKNFWLYTYNLWLYVYILTQNDKRKK